MVDGLQRLSSLLYFTSAEAETLSLVNRSSALKLNGLQKLSQLNGTSYPDLPKNIQLYFGRQPLQVISLTDKSDKSIRFDLFERLNAGSVALSPQEVRACIYRGEFNEFIEELSLNATFQSLLKLYESNNHDGTAAEQILKFFAYKNNSENFDGRVKIFLNTYMESAPSSFDYVTERETFERAANFLSDACGGGPFLRSGSAITPIVQFESCLVAAARIYEAGGAPKLPADNWIQDPQLLAASRGGGNTRSRLNERISRAMSLFGAE